MLSNYNPNSSTQQDGSFLRENRNKISGTSDNLQFTDASMIWSRSKFWFRKYGPGSVLSGKNVVSGFGTNDYETA